MEIAYRPIRIALLGAGSVGSQVARLLIENREELAQRVGADLELGGVRLVIGHGYFAGCARTQFDGVGTCHACSGRGTECSLAEHADNPDIDHGR